MSKNHRHYVHLCTEARRDDSSFVITRDGCCGSRVPACNKSQYVANTFINTAEDNLSPRKTRVVTLSLV